MSISSHRRDALDSALPLAHRASHARSCAVHVAQKWKVERSVVIDRVRRMCGVDLHAVASGEEIDSAVAALERIRFEGPAAFADDPPLRPST